MKHRKRSRDEVLQADYNLHSASSCTTLGGEVRKNEWNQSIFRLLLLLIILHFLLKKIKYPRSSLSHS